MIKEAAGRAEKELGAEIVIIKKTSPEYAKEKYPPPCPSVMVNGRLIAKNDIVSFETLKNAMAGDAGQKGA